MIPIINKTDIAKQTSQQYMLNSPNLETNIHLSIPEKKQPVSKTNNGDFNYSSDTSTIISERNNTVSHSHKNNTNGKGGTETKSEVAGAAGRYRDKADDTREVVAIQQFSTELKPHQDPNHNRLLLFQNKIKEEHSNNNNNVNQKT